jgi:NADH-quinone oxidoreductase subunit M
VLLAGVLLKLGVYGLYRVGVPLFPQQALAWAPTLGVVGLTGILWGAWAALGQSDLKRLVAYSSVSHMGFCLLGLASGTVAGATGGMVQAVTHGLSSGLLFLLVGVVYDRAHHRRVDGFGGLARPMPMFAWILLLGALAGAGLPALAGFPGEFLVLVGAFTGRGTFPWLGVFATLSVVLSAAYLLWTVKRVAYGPLQNEDHRSYGDLDGRERCALLPLVALLLLFGLWPAPLVDALRPACELLVQTLHGGRP